MIAPPLHGGGQGLNLLGSKLARMDTSSVLYSIYQLSSANVSCCSNRERSPHRSIVESVRREASSAAPSGVSSARVMSRKAVRARSSALFFITVRS